MDMMAYVLACPEEVSGYGLISSLPDRRTFVLDSVCILEQEVSAIHTTTQSMVTSRHLLELRRQGITTNRVRFQWHSHVHGSAYFSVIDVDNIQSYGEGWMISLVTNKRGEFEARIDQLSAPAFSRPIEVFIVDTPSSEQLDYARAEITAKVTRGTVFRRAVKADTAEQTVTIPAAHFATSNGGAS